MNSWKLEFRPHLPKYVFWGLAIIPLVVIPLGVNNYLNQGQDETHLFTTITIVVVLTIVLFGLLLAAQRTVRTDCSIAIKENILSITRKDQQKEVDLNEVDVVSLHSKFGLATEFRIQKHKGEEMSMNIAGIISKEDQASLKKIFKEADVKML